MPTMVLTDYTTGYVGYLNDTLVCKKAHNTEEEARECLSYTMAIRAWEAGDMLMAEGVIVPVPVRNPDAFTDEKCNETEEVQGEGGRAWLLAMILMLVGFLSVIAFRFLG